MKKRTSLNIISAVLAGMMAVIPFAGCKKKEATSAGGEKSAISDEALKAKLGFAAQVPADIEAYVASYNGGKLWERFKNSNAFKTFLATPLGQQVTSGLSAMTSNPQAKESLPIIRDLLGQESFVVYGNGAMEALLTLKGIGDYARFERIFSGAKGTPSLDVFIRGLEGETLQMPPLIFGFKAAAQKQKIDEYLESLSKQLPQGVEKNVFKLDDKYAFQSWIFSAEKLIPESARTSLRQNVEENASSAESAEKTFQEIMRQKGEVAIGWVGDYLLVSIGANHAHLTLAPVENSLLNKPEVVKVVSKYAGEEFVGFSWASPELIRLNAPSFVLRPIFDEVKDAIASSISGEEMKRIEADIARIDVKGAKLAPKKIDPVTCVAFWKEGIQLESYGGMKPLLMSAKESLQFKDLQPEAFLRFSQQIDAQESELFYGWLEDLCITGYGVLKDIALPKIDASTQVQFSMYEPIFVEPLKQLYHISRKELGASLGNQSAYIVDLKGVVPPLPFYPPVITQNGRLPQFIFVNDIKDRKLLSQSWGSFVKSIQQALAQTPVAAYAGMVESTAVQKDGDLEIYHYMLPMNTGDLVPHFGIMENKYWMIGTSLEKTKEIAGKVGAIAPAPATYYSFSLNMEAFHTFAEGWTVAAEKAPEFFFKNDPNAPETLKSKLPMIQEMLKISRCFGGLECKAFDEEGVIRQSLSIKFRDL